MLKKLVEQNVYALLTPMANLAGGIVVLLLFTRLLNTTDFGVLTTLISFTVLFTGISQLGVPNTLIKIAGKSFHSRDGHAGFYVKYLLAWNLAAMVVTCAAVLLFSPQLAQIFLHNQDFSYVIVVLAACVIFYTISQIIVYLFISIGRFEYQSLISIILNFSKALFPVVMVLVLGASLFAAVIGVLLSFLATGIASILFFKFRFKEELPYSPARTGEVNSFLFYSTILAWTSFMMLNVDSLVLNYFSGPAEVAIFGVSNSIVMFIISLLPASSVFVLSFLVEMGAKKQREMQKKFFDRGIKYGLIASIPFAFLFYLTANRVVSFFWPPTYASAAIPLRILSLELPFAFLSGICISVFMSEGKMRELTWNMAVYYLFTFGISFYLIPTYGLAGTAITFLLSQILQAVVLLRFSLGMLKMRFNFRYVYQPLIPSLIIAALIILLNSYDIMRSTILLFITAGIIFSLCYMPFLDADDKKLINALLSFVKLEPLFKLS